MWEVRLEGPCERTVPAGGGAVSGPWRSSRPLAVTLWGSFSASHKDTKELEAEGASWIPPRPQSWGWSSDFQHNFAALNKKEMGTGSLSR